MNTRRLIFCFLILFTAFVFLMQDPDPASAEPEIKLSKGQTIYTPVYSHIYTGNKGRPFNLAVTLSIRNTDPENPVTIDYVDYYDTEGKLLKHYIDKPVVLKSLATTRYIITEFDKTGGSGANFLVKWSSKKAVNIPIVESIMIGTQSQQGLSFLSRGQAIKEGIGK